MFYYRYRPYNEVSIKELLYNEMYFSSPEKCNDPFDSKTFYEFGADKEMWSRVIKFSVKMANDIITDELADLLAEHLCKKSPLTFDEAHKANLFEDLPEHSSIIAAMSRYGIFINRLLSIYKPATRYFVSFSKVNSEPLMWSHYADTRDSV
jgi:hypothetical protein